MTRDDVAALLGWAPSARIPGLAARLADIGGAVAPLPSPRGIQPPTAAAPDSVQADFAPLVNTYTTVPYADVDPTVLAGLAYIVMFGAMFGDAGHGALLVLGALAIRQARPKWPARLQPYWRFIAGAGLFSILFGLLYGECFGPTGLVPTLWLAPTEQPVTLLLAGVGLGAVLLSGAYALGSVNRIRESGWPVALTAPSGLAGSALFLAAGLAVVGWYLSLGWLLAVAVLLALAGLALVFAGLIAEAGGGASGAFQALIETFDVVIRLGSNTVSFARLAAFGLTHAVLTGIVWAATAGLWQRGAAGVVAAIVVFAVGNAFAFSLEALVAGVQALRLEYYELFSRVFQREGRPFRPWHVPTDTIGEAPCSPG
jgi:V/A-type H+-transporting ATPase subunit I